MPHLVKENYYLNVTFVYKMDLIVYNQIFFWTDSLITGNTKMCILYIAS